MDTRAARRSVRGLEARYGLANDDGYSTCASRLCVHCDYDLTRNMTGVCSECGTRIERSEGDEVA